MADSGAENLRKQIAYLSNLIDSHKSGKQNDKVGVKNIPNPKQNKTWSRWKSEPALIKSNLNKSEHSSQDGRRNLSIDGGSSRSIKNMKSYSNVEQSNQQKGSPSMKYKLHSKLTSTKSAPTVSYGHPSLSKATALTKPPLISADPVAKSPSKMVVRTPKRHLIKDQPYAILRQPNSNLRWTKNDKTPQIQGLKSSGTNKVVSPNHKTATKWPSSNSYQPSKPNSTTRHFSNAVYTGSSRSHMATTSNVNRTVVLPNSGKPLKKATSVSVLPSSSSDSNSSSILKQRTVALPKSIKLLAKSISLPTGTTRDLLGSLPNANNTSSASHRRVVHLPKNHKPTSKVIYNPNTNVQASTSLDRRTVNLPRNKNTNSKVLNNTSKNSAQLTTLLDRRTTALPKSHRISSRVSITKSSMPNATAKGAKLKWRRKSAGASQLRTDSSSKNSRSKNLLGNAVQTRMALKSKWQKAKARPTTLRKTVSISKINHSNAKVIHLPNNRKSKVVIRSPYTKSICQSGNIAKRSKLKWSKTLSQPSLKTQSEQTVVRSKPRFLHKSRFCLKRRKSSEEKVSGIGGRFVQGTSRVKLRTGLIRKIKSQNKGFVARRMKYMALGSQTPNRTFLSKYSLVRNGQSQLRRKVKIGGSVYVISSHGKTLKKTPNTNDKTKVQTPLRRNSLRIYRRPSSGSSSSAVNRIFKRQDSVDKKKSRTANKILKRTLQNVQAVMRKVKKQKSKEYCMFYNKFGKCTKHTQGKCPYIHDPTKIAVCTRFLRGKCQQMDGTCPFSHKIDKEKMPICQYFLKGKCNRDNCPYSHVNVGQRAVVCEDFLKGYCPLGFKCTKKHVLECEEFTATGKCSNREKCKLIHRAKTQQQRRKRYFDEQSCSLDEEDNSRVVKKSRRSSDGFLPLEDSLVSEDEHSTQSHRPEEEAQSRLSIRIRPNFASRDNADEEQ